MSDSTAHHRCRRQELLTQMKIDVEQMAQANDETYEGRVPL